MSRLPPLNWLRTFESAARHRNFTRAGEELGLTQAAVSKHIQHLESWLRQPLFERLPHSLKLTSCGEHWLPLVQSSLRGISEGIGDVFGARGGEQLVVSLNVAWATLVVAPNLHAYFDREPDTELRITHAIWERDSSSPSAEIEVRYGRGEWSGLHALPLAEESITPVIAGDASGRDSWQDRPWLKVLGYGTGWSDWCAHAGIRPQRTRIEFDQSVAAYNAAANGLGVVLGRRSLIRDLLADRRLQLADERALPIDEGFFVCWRADRRLSPAATSFRDWMLTLREE
ncbi:LysR substrate-binding domain-containing protein [Gammaproteobacteria bacterium]|nr:LysR substrate-binding domain-containing protein [Gammaproteobacteria bacterium]